MTKMIQVRNVPDEVHATLKRRAADRKQTLTAYVEMLLEREARTLSRKELVERIKSREPVIDDRSSADYLREAREEREAELMRRIERSERS